MAFGDTAVCLISGKTESFAALEFGQFQRVTPPLDRYSVMVGSRFRVTGVGIPQKQT